MFIQILVDNPKSWILPYAKKLKEEIKLRGFHCTLIQHHDSIQKGDILILLSCEKILKHLDLNNHNLVVHESELPQGKGWSPLTWQILEGKNSIPITLFEAAENVDAGIIYFTSFINLEGHELINEIRKKQGEETIKLILKFLVNYPIIKGNEQCGNSTYYKRRSKKDSELNINESINDQFNLLRVCDNEQYPAFFIRNGIKYIIKIYKENECCEEK